ncbi:MAG: ABC transporter ATP-binding protein [Desulfobacterales bacterium]|nr:MAG: ABC transporter ATP-binding protein [Desulfobacterales bacterium]
MAILRIDNIRKAFGGVVALNGCSFDVKDNSITGLIGPNGSGKTSLFNVITGFYRADDGVIYFKDREITRLRPYEIAQEGIVRTFQITRVFSGMTVMENMLYAPKQQLGESFLRALFQIGPIRKQEEVNRQKAMELLELVGLDELHREYAANLSYGQKKLLELGRSLLTSPELIMLDEPAAGINPTMINKMKKVILDLHREGKTFLIIEHDMQFVMSICENVFVLDFGAKISEGPPEFVQKDKNVVKAYLGTTYDFGN